MARKTAIPTRTARRRWRALPLLAIVAALLAVPSVAAAAVIFTGTNPASPANEEQPLVKGTSNGPVTLYDGIGCTHQIGSGTQAEFASPGIAVTVAPNSSTQIYGKDNDGCAATPITYVEDSTVPDVPTVDSTDPASPADENNPKVKGTAEPGSTVKIYPTSDCSGTELASGPQSDYSSTGIAVAVEDDSTTTFYATATDAAGNVSGCSTTSVTYVEDSTAAPPVLTGTDPASPANQNNPKVKGTAETGSTVKLYTNADCSGAEVASGPESDLSAGGIGVSVTDNSTTTFHATATDAAGNVSECSESGVTYVEDSQAPAAPSVAATLPGGPANDNTPEVTGGGEPGSTILVYAGDCSGTPVAVGSEAVYATDGLTASVADNSTTTLRAAAVDAAGNVSACSTSSVTYVEDSIAPNTRVSFAPLGKTRDRTPTFLFGALGDSENVSFQCSLDKGPLKRCGSPKTYGRLSLKHHIFMVRAVDEAGNSDPSPVRRGFRIVRRHRHR